MPKIDLKKDLKPLYQPSAKHPVEVHLPPLNYLMIDGQGDPNTSPDYTHAVQALFTISYTNKFAIKNCPQAIDYTVMPLEGLWWADDMSAFTADDKANWKWTMMILQPSFITREIIHQSIATVAKKKPLPALEKLRFETLSEGRCAQILHLGPFTEEGPTIARLHHFIDSQHAKKSGKHHEIYLSDIRRANPNKWRTILRQPMI